MSKSCKECVFYTPPREGFSCGRCDYPVPEWLKVGSSGGGFVYGHEGQNCVVRKTRASILSKVKTPEDGLSVGYQPVETDCREPTPPGDE